MLSIIPAVIAAFAGTLVLSFFYWYLYKQYRERYIGLWALSWAFVSFRYVFDVIMAYKPDIPILILGQLLVMLTSSYLLLWGTHEFTGRLMARWWVYGTVLNAIWIIIGFSNGFSFAMLHFPLFSLQSLIYIWTGLAFLRTGDIKGVGKTATGWAVIIWGIHKIDYPFLKQVAWFAPWGYLLSSVLGFIVAMGSLLVYFQRIRENLTTSEKQFRLLADNAQDLVYSYQFAPERKFEYVSPSSLIITGYAPEEYYSDPELLYKIVHPDDLSLLQDVRKIAGVNGDSVVFRTLRRDGKIIWTEHHNAPVYDETNNVTGFEGIARDITARKEADEAFKRYQLLCEHARDVILFFRRDGRIIEANEAAVKSYSYTHEELASMNVSDLRASDSKAQLAEHIRQAESKSILFETSHRRKDNSTFPVEVSLQGTNIENEQVLFAIVRDITDRKLAEKTISHLAYHDSLTGLPNRILFYDRLTLELAHSKRHKQMLAVVFLDLDRFKNVNDTMGHAVGDQLLKDFSVRLTNCVRESDTVSRLGGDEFTLLLPYINDEEDVARIAQKIITALKQPWIFGSREFILTTSIGIAIYPRDGEDAETLMKNADTAMYRAKEQGNTCQFYTPAMNARALERLELERALRKAVEDNEFEVYYQPQVNIKTRTIVGLEALIRWNNPQRGPVLPLEFIPIAEDTGFIIPIGEWVLRTACAQNKAWQEAGISPARIAVNISAYQFRQKQFVETVAQVLKETGMDPNLLELEITESTAIQDVDFTISMLESLRKMGIGIAIDDFGTGYSSLSYLRRFPITTLKVDRIFVKEVLTNVEDAAIVATIIVLAQNLKLKVIIEGVETESQLAFFQQQECFEMQGYLFSEPRPAGEIEKLLKKAMAV